MIVVNFFDLMEKQAKSLEEFSKFQKQAYKLINQAKKTHELFKDTPFENDYKEVIKNCLESVAHLLADLDRPKGKRIDWNGDDHCMYCAAPGPKAVMKTYDGDTCQIYYDYSDIRYEYEISKTSFTLEEITLQCRKSFLEKYPDVPDFDETIKEMLIDIDLDLGVVEKIGDNLFQAV